MIIPALMLTRIKRIIPKKRGDERRQSDKLKYV
jgi:hypothetical protein